MRERKEAVALIQDQLATDGRRYKEKTYWHYGAMELRELMDFIYGGEPKTEEEKIKKC